MRSMKSWCLVDRDQNNYGTDLSNRSVYYLYKRWRRVVSDEAMYGENDAVVNAMNWMR